MKKFRSLLAFATLSAATIVGMAACGTTEEPEEIVVTWSGLDDITIQLSDEVPSLTEGVTAKDQDGNELKVVVDEENSDTVNNMAAGAYTIWYTAYDSEDNAISEDNNGTATRTVFVEQGTYIENSTFDTGTSKWSGNGNAGSVMSYSWDETEKALKVDITNSGNEYWNNQVEYNGLNLKKGVTYCVSFKAKSTTGRNIGASLEVPSAGYAIAESQFGNSVGLKTSTEYQEFKYYYTSDADYNAVKLGILLGRFTEADDAASTVWIDDVKVTALDKAANSTGVTFTGETHYDIHSYEEFEAIPAVTATDKDGNDITSKLVHTGEVPTSFPAEFTSLVFGDMYTYTDNDGNISYFRRQFNYTPEVERENEWQLMNEEFEDGLKYWNKEENDWISITENDDATVTIAATKDSGSDADWKAQLQQNNSGNVLKAGETYYVEVKAKIDTTDVRTLRLEFCANDGGNTNAKTDLIFTTANEYQVFKSAEYTPTKDISGGALRVGLLLGEYSAKYNLTVDYIKLIKKVA